MKHYTSILLPLLCALTCCVVSCVGKEQSITFEKKSARSLGRFEEHPPGDEYWAQLSDAQWKQILNPQEVNVCREGGTERAFSGQYESFKGSGVFYCSSCGAPLFDSYHKFDSGTGWPSFTQPITQQAVGLKPDTSWGMSRTEVVCSHCGAHLGHVFDDGPAPTGKRYCINSVCLLHQKELSSD